MCATNRNIATEASATTVFLSYEIISYVSIRKGQVLDHFKKYMMQYVSNINTGKIICKLIKIYIHSNKCAQKRTIAIDSRGYIPGQLDGLHGIVSLENPTHSEPPYFGSSQTRVRYINPRPHDFEQADQFDQFNQNPSTKILMKHI